MPDKLTPQQRHHCMQSIRSHDTRPERVVRRFLFSHGFRYRLQVKRLPGRPDIVMRRLGVCIFINGCFWHGHLINDDDNDALRYDDNGNNDALRYDDDALRYDDPSSNSGQAQSLRYDDVRVPKSSACCKIPKTNTEFWVAKILRNRERDARVQRELEALGWHVITIWECELRPKQREATLQRLLTLLRRIEAPVLVQELRKTASYANSYSDNDLLMAAEDEEEYSSYNNIEP